MLMQLQPITLIHSTMELVQQNAQQIKPQIQSMRADLEVLYSTLRFAFLQTQM